MVSRSQGAVEVSEVIGMADAASDAVVIGSKLVELLERQPADNVASTGAAFIREIRAALDKKD